MVRSILALPSIVLGATLALLIVAHADVITRRMPAPKDLHSHALVEAVEEGKLEAIKDALTHKPDFDYQGIYGQTALEMAIQQGKLEVVRLLVEGGAPLASSRFPNRPTALHAAAEKGNLEVTRFLIERKAPLEPRNDAGETPLMFAMKTCNLEVVRLLLDAGSAVDGLAQSGATALFYAIAANKLECVNELLRRGASPAVAARRIVGYWAGDYTPLGAAASLGNIEVMKALLDRGADANQAGPDGTTPLSHAAQRSQVAAVRALLTAKADPNRADGAGVTPLLIAARKDDKEVALVLLAGGADPTILVNVCERPLELLIETMKKDAPELRKPLAKYLTKTGRPKKPLPSLPVGKAEFGELCMKSQDCNSQKGFVCVPDSVTRTPYSGTCLMPVKTPSK